MAAQVAPSEEVGRTIAGRYVVEALLGGGGMSAVYRVRDLRRGSTLALKRGLSTSKSKPSKPKQLLEREFHTLAQLAHPSIIEVYDFGVDELGPYYTMELLDGSDLHNGGQVPWRETCALLRDVASSLALLHSRGLIHRDVSARNVRRRADGSAKLIDFGAMTSMGVAKDVVGTPPFLAPEVLQMQALDGRADLYSLGALGYYMLTGTHAYPARKFRDLRDAWRSRPPPTTKYQADVPGPLNALIMQLLSLDRGGRLQSAAEVMHRLCTIAGLPIAEDTLVSRAYLTTPSLLGRDAALVAVRRRMLNLARGDGGTLLIVGSSGTGRSRLLDACALEAKMVGAAVLRADASDERTPWGVARVLGSQLVQLMPEQAAEAAQLARDVLCQVIDGLRTDSVTSVSGIVAERGLLIRELRDFILALARVQRLVVVVDDADQIDEPSAALLAALAHKTARHPVILALSTDREVRGETSSSLRFLQLIADPVEVDALDAEQTEALLRSVFGDVPRLSIVASRIHALSLGKPRNIMELAQHLVDRGLARYEAGSWSLPVQLSERDLPVSLAASLATRLSSVSHDAIEICEALCLADADGDLLSIANYARVTSHGDQQRVFRALDELVIARILVADTERHRFSQRGFLSVIDQGTQPARRQALHARLADLLAESGGDVLRRCEHLLACGREREALELLSAIDLRARGVSLALLERVVDAGERHNLPARELHDLRRALVQRAVLDMALEQYHKHAPILLAELLRDSGLARYAELEGVPEQERVARALSDARAHFDAQPPHEQIQPPKEAITELAAFCGGQRSLAVATFDASLMEQLPSLAPLIPLSNLLRIVEVSGQAGLASLQGRYQRARELYSTVLGYLSGPESEGMSAVERVRATSSIHLVLGLVDAGRGIPTAEAHADALERERAYQVNAWRVRMLWHLTLGDSDEAARCRRRAELTLLREGGVQQYPGTTALGELLCHTLMGDLTGVMQTNEVLAQLGTRFEGWRPFMVYGQAVALRLQGDAAQALALILPLLETQHAGTHPSFPYLGALHVQLLCDLDRVDEAVACGRRYVGDCDREDLSPTGHSAHISTAVALARAGQHAESVALLERVIALATEHGQGGVCIGSMYEARARVAAIMEDAPTFEHYFALCSDAYQHGKNVQLGGRLARLLEEARHAVGHVDSTLPTQAMRSEPAASSEYATLHSRMLECVDEGDRARCALTILLQSLDSFAGYLYGVNEDDHVLLAALPEDDVDPQLGEWFARLLASEVERDPAQTLDSDPPPSAAEDVSGDVPFRYTDARGREFEPLFLIRHDGPEHRLAAVLVFHAGRDGHRHPGRELQEELADQLLAHGDVAGVRLAAAGTQTRTR